MLKRDNNLSINCEFVGSLYKIKNSLYGT